MQTNGLQSSFDAAAQNADSVFSNSYGASEEITSSSYLTGELQDRFNENVDLNANFANDMGQYLKDGLIAKMSYEQSLLDKAGELGTGLGEKAKGGFSETVNVIGKVGNFGKEGLKKKMEYEKALINQGYKNAQTAAGLGRKGFGKMFNAASNLGGGIFRQGSGALGKSQSAAEGALGYGVGLAGGSGGGGGGAASLGLGGGSGGGAGIGIGGFSIGI